MKRVICAIGVLAIMLFAVPVLAQGAFTDVPTEHWAYEAVDQLANNGIIVGYPDGTFSGKRALTRFEFAQAISRAVPLIVEMAKGGPAGVTPEQLAGVDARLKAVEAKIGPDVSGLAKQSDLDAIKKLVDEFSGELAVLGVSIDALKKQVDDLATRVAKLEAEDERVRITGEANAVAIGEKTREGEVLDLDGRILRGDDNILDSVMVTKSIDLTIIGKVPDKATVVAVISAGNYLSYLGNQVDGYAGGFRPVNTATGLTDGFYPYYTYMEIPVGSGSITAGRFPIQWTPYTLKMRDVDSYATNSLTDSGDYPLDGIKGSCKLGVVGIQAFAAKVDTNGVLRGTAFGFMDNVGNRLVPSQLAGIRAQIPTPLEGNLGLTYMEASVGNVGGYNKGSLMGADLNIEAGKLAVGAEWAETKGLSDYAGNPDIDTLNTALDANVGLDIGKVGVKAGWKSIGSNFSAPGSWDKIGINSNPVNIEGLYAALDFDIMSNLNLTLGAELLSGRDNIAGTFNDETQDDVNFYTAGLKWGFSAANTVDLGLQWVKYEPFQAPTSDEKYITIGLSHEFGANVTARVAYQIIDFDAGESSQIYSTSFVNRCSDSKGNIAVAQVSVKF